MIASVPFATRCLIVAVGSGDILKITITKKENWVNGTISVLFASVV